MVITAAYATCTKAFSPTDDSQATADEVSAQVPTNHGSGVDTYSFLMTVHQGTVQTIHRDTKKYDKLAEDPALPGK